MNLRQSDAPRAPKEVIFDRALTRVASVTIFGSMMSILDTTIVNVALDTLVKTFHTTLATIQWVSTGYLLALATVVPLTRWIVDRFGTKKAWMVSVALFLGGSLLCGLAWSATSLICFRVLQGLGGGMIMPIGQTIIVRQSGPHRLGRVMTVIGVPQLLGPMLGPVIGGLILTSFSWRFIFFVNLPIGIFALLRARKALPPGELGESRRLDLVGMALLSPGLGLLIYGISEFGNDGQFSPHVDFGIGLGLALIAAFVWHALTAEQPLLDLRLWKNRGLAISTTTVFLFGAGMNSAIFLVPLYYQIARGATPLRAALLMASGGAGAMIGMPIAGKLMDRYGARRIVPFGLLLIAITVIPYTQVGAHTSETFLAVVWFFRGIGAGATGMPATAAGYATLRHHQIAGATTINNIAQRIGNSLGVAFAAVLLQRRIASFFPKSSVAKLAELSPRARIAVAPSLAHAFGFVFWITVVLGLVAIIPALRLPAPVGRTQHGDEEFDLDEDAELHRVIVD